MLTHPPGKERDVNAVLVETFYRRLLGQGNPQRLGSSCGCSHRVVVSQSGTTGFQTERLQFKQVRYEIVQPSLPPGAYSFKF
jgi:hypothetical protein